MTLDDEVSNIRRLTNDEISDSLNDPISVCYTLADMDKTRFNFCQVFEHRDTQQYFAMMRKFSANSLSKLIDNRRSYHLYRSVVRGELRNALKAIHPGLAKGDVLPEIYHFALYTADNGDASRDTGIRSPRVYFVLAEAGRIYPVFFDPFHELNPTY